MRRQMLLRERKELWECIALGTQWAEGNVKDYRERCGIKERSGLMVRSGLEGTYLTGGSALE